LFDVPSLTSDKFSNSEQNREPDQAARDDPQILGKHAFDLMSEEKSNGSDRY
jgi:hypothetical protein